MKTFHLIGSLFLVSLTAACTAQTVSPSGGQSQASRGSEGTADAGPACTTIAFGGSSQNGAVGLANPSALYCLGLGYSLDGSDCVFPDGNRCEEWAFFRGECGQSHSFCNRHGGSIANVTEDRGGGTASLGVCTLAGKQCDEVTFASTCTCEGNAPPHPTPAPDAGSCQPLPAPGGSANPASVYCAALGNQLDGSDCVFADGSRCEEWSFYRGQCGQAHSFCNLHGGSVANVTEDAGGWTASYAECTVNGVRCKDSAFAESCECK